jgi:hypothetical protein
VFGFAFTSAGLLFLAGRLDQAVRLRWLWPVLLLALGLGILLDLNVRRPKGVAETPATLDEPEPPAVERPEAEPEEAEPAGTAELEPEGRPEEAEAAGTAELEPEGPPPDRDR